MDIGHDIMGVIIINSYTHGVPSVPLAAQLDLGTLQDFADMSALASGSIASFTTPFGALDATVIPSGGTGSYTFSWTLTKISENSLPLHPNFPFFSVNTIGATNTSNLRPTIDGARGANGGDVFDAEFQARCVVSDGVDAVIVNHIFTVVAASF